MISPLIRSCLPIPVSMPGICEPLDGSGQRRWECTENQVDFSKEAGKSFMATRSTPPAAQSEPRYVVPFIIVTALFGIFKFPTNLNSNLMPHLKQNFDLTYGPAMLVSIILIRTSAFLPRPKPVPPDRQRFKARRSRPPTLQRGDEHQGTCGCPALQMRGGRMR